MQIIGGCARNIVLNVPPGIGVRPTAGRARKALFDSLGGRLAGSCVLDLCAGSGALALEAASRGAVKAVLVESDPRHIRVIEENIERVRRTGVECEFDVIQASAGNVAAYIGRLPFPGVIFADPPYAQSAALFGEILGSPRLRERAAGALVVWEIPDAPGSVGEFLKQPLLADRRIRKFGGTDFLLGEVPV